MAIRIRNRYVGGVTLTDAPEVDVTEVPFTATDLNEATNVLTAYLDEQTTLEDGHVYRFIVDALDFAVNLTTIIYFPEFSSRIGDVYAFFNSPNHQYRFCVMWKDDAPEMSASVDEVVRAFTPTGNAYQHTITFHTESAHGSYGDCPQIDFVAYIFSSSPTPIEEFSDLIASVDGFADLTGRNPLAVGDQENEYMEQNKVFVTGIETEASSIKVNGFKVVDGVKTTFYNTIDEETFDYGSGTIGDEVINVRFDGESYPTYDGESEDIT